MCRLAAICGRVWLVGGVACLGAVVSGAGPVPAQEVVCGGHQNVTVHYSSDREDALLACEAAAEAIRFLAEQGFNASADVRINLIRKLPEIASTNAVGIYHEPDNVVYALLYSEFTKHGSWFGAPIDRSSYRSVLTHEVAHAIAAANFTIAKPSIVAKEYIAYVTTFATMMPERREHLLSQYPGEAFEGDLQMNTTIYLFDPLHFGVRAYRHFLKPPNGSRYLHAVLSGKALNE